jgi:hypothetical protein
MSATDRLRGLAKTTSVNPNTGVTQSLERAQVFSRWRRRTVEKANPEPQEQDWNSDADRWVTLAESRVELQP